MGDQVSVEHTPRFEEKDRDVSRTEDQAHLLQTSEDGAQLADRRPGFRAGLQFAGETVYYIF